MKKRLYIETVGCQMNVLDSEMVVASLRKHDYELVETIEDADAFGAVEAIPWFLRPLLPALLYVTALVALEYARLRGELIYLKNQLRSDARPASG